MSCPAGLSPGFAVSATESAAICFLKSYFGIGSDGLGVYATGTGLLIDSGPAARHIVTAAHNICRHGIDPSGRSRDAVWTSLWFRRNGSNSLATRDVIRSSCPARFRDAPSPPADSDYAILRVNPLASDRFSGVTLAESTAGGETDKLLVGYPDEDGCQGSAKPWYAQLVVAPSGPANYGYRPHPTYAGMSGGPLFTREQRNGALRCWGIHIRGGDGEPRRAIRFSAPVLTEIDTWL